MLSYMERTWPACLSIEVTIAVVPETRVNLRRLRSLMLSILINLPLACALQQMTVNAVWKKSEKCEQNPECSEILHPSPDSYCNYLSSSDNQPNEIRGTF